MNNFKKKLNPFWAALLMIAAVFMIFAANQEVKVEIKDSEINIIGSYGEVTISFKDLLRIDTISVLPAIELKTNGYSFGDTKSGDFRLADGTDVKLFIKTGFPPYILLKSKNAEPVYINFEDRQKTIKLYREISGKTKRK